MDNNSSGDRAKKRYSLRLKQNTLRSEEAKHETTEVTLAGPANVNRKNSNTVAEQDKSTLPNGKVDVKCDAAKNSSRLVNKRKKVVSKQKGRRYLLRSSLDGVRILRSMSNAKSKTLSESNVKCKASPESNAKCNTPFELVSNPVAGKRKKRRKLKRSPSDEFSKTRKRVRYLLTRMGYEQNLIDAYAGEGWRGQSAEKIRPEKELERAKSEILRCKSRIRDLFKNLESLSSEGRLEESLFDEEGEIDSEDIFCAKCGSKDLTADNDIILCDGICDRGFHQKCLNPPLLSDDIPTGDDGWLCPACDCKVDCIELVNEFQGSDLVIEDPWEEVFPEAATIANGDNQYNDLPSDDSEDNDYDPDVLEADNQKEESLSDESDFTSSSEDSSREKQDENVGLSSDDSEDDDYDPDGRDPDGNIQKDGTSSDASDFTSDSDEFCVELSKTAGANEDSEDSAPSLMNLKPLAQSIEGKSSTDRNNSSINSEHLSMGEPDLNEENALPVSGKRQRETLDYEKLYDETYGKTSSDSSDDEDWLNMCTPKKGKKDGTTNESNVLLKANAQTIANRRSSRSAAQKLTEAVSAKKSGIDQPRGAQVVSESTSKKPRPKSNSYASSHKEAEPVNVSWEAVSKEDMPSSSASRRLGRNATQKLQESFRENQYPSHEIKESLAVELGLTPQQVNKWFVNTRHSFRVSAKGSTEFGVSAPAKGCNLTTTDRGYIKSNERAGLNSIGGEGNGRESVQSRISEIGSQHDNDNGNGGTVKEAMAKDLPQVSNVVSESTPKRTQPTLESSTLSHEESRHLNNSKVPDVDDNKFSTPVSRRLGSLASQKLYKSFQENQYPNREKKESLAEELGITLQQVNKWFDNTRHSYRTYVKESSRAISTPDKTSGKRVEYDEGVTQTPPSKNGIEKISVEAANSQVRVENGKGDGDSVGEAADEQRQKAVARELRRMKAGR